MRKIIFSILIGCIIISCNFFGSVENSIQTNNVEYSEKDITGKWKLDKFSYEYLSKKDNLDSIVITFKADRTFILNNSIDLFDRIDYKPNEKVNGKIDNNIIKGKWKITNHANKDLILIFNNNLNKTGLSVYKKGKEYQIWYFLNDPDTGQRLRFLKE
jgi:hypothetical protein